MRERVPKVYFLYAVVLLIGLYYHGKLGQVTYDKSSAYLIFFFTFVFFISFINADLFNRTTKVIIGTEHFTHYQDIFYYQNYAIITIGEMKASSFYDAPYGVLIALKSSVFDFGGGNVAVFAQPEFINKEELPYGLRRSIENRGIPLDVVCYGIEYNDYITEFRKQIVGMPEDATNQINLLSDENKKLRDMLKDKFKDISTFNQVASNAMQSFQKPPSLFDKLKGG